MLLPQRDHFCRFFQFLFFFLISPNHFFVERVIYKEKKKRHSLLWCFGQALSSSFLKSLLNMKKWPSLEADLSWRVKKFCCPTFEKKHLEVDMHIFRFKMFLFFFHRSNVSANKGTGKLYFFFLQFKQFPDIYSLLSLISTSLLLNFLSAIWIILIIIFYLSSAHCSPPSLMIIRGSVLSSLSPVRLKIQLLKLVLLLHASLSLSTWDSWQESRNVKVCRLLSISRWKLRNSSSHIMNTVSYLLVLFFSQVQYFYSHKYLIVILTFTQCLLCSEAIWYFIDGPLISYVQIVNLRLL